tara:strand:- start:373 stop:492 length:120 start_codon:yes stop_codon:yes gene_type:complete
MRILWLIVVVVVLVGCSSNGKKKYNPITTVIRVVTGDIR